MTLVAILAIFAYAVYRCAGIAERIFDEIVTLRVLD